MPPYPSGCSNAEAHERAGLLSAFYVEGYLSFSLPAILTGLLAPVAECARSGNEPANDDLDALVLAAYNVNHSAVEPLLEWTYVRKND